MGIYRDLAKSPGVFRIIVAQLTARFPFGMLSIAMLLHIELTYGNYTAAGIVLAIFSAGSIVGGLMIGGRQVTPWSLFWRILIVAGGTLLCLFSLDMWWLSLVLFFGGFGVAPSLAAIFTIVSSTVKFSETAEAFGWVGTGQLIGVALGSAIAGFAIDRFGPMGAISASAAFLVLAAIAAAISSGWIPDMRGRDAAPIPDTAPITLPQV